MMKYNRLEIAIHEKLKKHLSQKTEEHKEIFAVRMELPSKESGIITKITCNNPHCSAQELVVGDMNAPFPYHKHTSIIEFTYPELVFHRPEIRYNYNSCDHCDSMHVIYDIEKYIDKLIEEI